jgi:hypothetical protein
MTRGDTIASNPTQARNLAKVAFFLAGVRPGWTVRVHPGEMKRDAIGRQLRHFRFDRRISRRHQESYAGTPSLHDCL